MRRSSTSRSVTSAIVAVALVGVLAVMAGVAASGNPTPSPSGGPSASPTSPSTPVSSPSDAPASPSPAPSDGAGIPLDIATPHDVSVIVDDETGRVVKVSSGRAGDGMSVRWFDTIVENIDADSIRVTWVGLPQDDVVRLTVSEQDGAIELAFVQKAPPANSDALGHDRVVVIDFDSPVDASDVVTSVEES
jgi:hypothetical protein